MSWLSGLVSKANALFNRFESDADLAHGFAGSTILLGLRLVGLHFWLAILITAIVAISKEIILEQILAKSLNRSETWAHSLRDTAAWGVGILIGALVPHGR